MRPIKTMPVSNGNNQMVKMLYDRIGHLERAILNKQENHWNMSNGEWKKSVKKANDWTEYVNKIV
jgi:hypothetical protein